MDALTGLSDFVDRLNSKLAEIPRVIPISVPSLAPSTGAAASSPVAQSGGGVDAEALAEHLFPHISDRLDARDRLRGTR